MDDLKIDKKFVKKSTLIECISWLNFCKNFIIQHYPDSYIQYKEFIDESDGLVFRIQAKKHITSKDFEKLNDWFCSYANGLVGFDFETILPNDYLALMDFTTTYCFAYSDVDKKTIYYYFEPKSYF